ncbi:hypothetical protein FXN61_15520 [Lentzea sp. PSKA42]|uniref:Uncharacterized protein n=1 Tax=Lentzea indica TaxID=2604800 RepID=A0ABX1FGZ1_9PSEU|nr:hypothetical protein [Lentzea indica]NKE58157.1 hypothetical protein [Lentzea indica]
MRRLAFHVRSLAHRKVIRARLKLSDELVHAVKPVAAARELVVAGYPLWATYWFGILTRLLTTRLSAEDLAKSDPGFAGDLFALSDIACSELAEPAWRMTIEALSSMLAQSVGNRTITPDHALFLVSLLKGRARRDRMPATAAMLRLWRRCADQRLPHPGRIISGRAPTTRPARRRRTRSLSPAGRPRPPPP